MTALAEGSSDLGEAAEHTLPVSSAAVEQVAQFGLGERERSGRLGDPETLGRRVVLCPGQQDPGPLAVRGQAIGCEEGRPAQGGQRLARQTCASVARRRCGQLVRERAALSRSPAAQYEPERLGTRSQVGGECRDRRGGPQGQAGRTRP